MSQQIADITWELTGSELVALLLESYEIKRMLPVYNRAQRRNTFSFGLFDKLDSNGYLNLEIKRIKEGDQPLTSSPARPRDRTTVLDGGKPPIVSETMWIVQDQKGPVFYGLKQCRGACVGEGVAGRLQPTGWRRRCASYQFTDDSFGG